jgi:hypothetical protein
MKGTLQDKQGDSQAAVGGCVCRIINIEMSQDRVTSLQQHRGLVIKQEFMHRNL